MLATFPEINIEPARSYFLKTDDRLLHHSESPLPCIILNESMTLVSLLIIGLAIGWAIDY